MAAPETPVEPEATVEPEIPVPETREQAMVRRDRRAELLAAILLSLATVVTAWSAYQATRWSGVQAENYTVASAKRTESVRASNEANRQVLIDVDTFLSWIDAAGKEDQALADDIHERMRPEFLVAFDTWIVSGEPGEDIPPATPFALPEYVLETQQEADRLEGQAAVAFEAGGEANQTSDNFVLAAVLLASVLFFAGLAGTFDSLRAQVLLLSLGAVVFLIGAAIVVTLPQNVGF